jgi:hypothetical protein
MATIGAESFSWLVLAFASLAIVAGLAYGVWSLRPLPSYSSDAVALDTPLDVTFTVENTGWFPLRRMKLTCILMQPGTSDMPTVAASDLRLPEGSSSVLQPDASATFKCPFRAMLGGSNDHQLSVASRSDIFFRVQYDAPFVESLRLTDERGPYFLNTHLLPPRWTAKAP